MKKISFIGIVILLICMIICLVGYNTLVIQNESKELKKIKNQNTAELEKERTYNETPTIYCIGDSLTMGQGSSSYPTALSALTGFSVNKIGGKTNQTIDIAIKLGRIKIYTQNMTIPKTVKTIPITLYDEHGEKLDVLKGSLGNFKNIEIDGISGILSYDATTQQHMFTRNDAGKGKAISSLTQIISKIPKIETKSIAIIFTGTYDSNISNGIFKTITYQRAIIKQLKVKKYIVVSLTSKRVFPIVNDMNVVLKEEHGEHFLDFRSYLLKSGLKDANIKATRQDKKDLNQNYIPSSLLRDDRNGNSKFNQLLAEQLIKKMIELKYIDEKQLKDK